MTLHLISDRAVRLSDVPVGFTVRLHDAQLDAQLRSQLGALGLTDGSLLRVCKQGEPCVVQVRTTRVGISGQIAKQLFVIAANAAARREMPWR
jgi:Fe2+ transport system protein FeoA